MSRPEQLTLDLFPSETSCDKPEEGTQLGHFLRWAHDTHHCHEGIDDVARRVFAEMPDPFDRCKALVTVFRIGRDGSECVPLLGLFDEEDYHTCWDRAWAVVHGVPYELIPRIRYCKYRCGSGRHSFLDEEGNLIYQLGGE